MKKFFTRVILLAIVLVVAVVIFVRAAPDAPRLDGFGMSSSTVQNTDASQLPGVISLMHGMGVGWDREIIPWNETQTDENTIRWQYGTTRGYRDYTQLIENAKRNRMDILAVLDGGPAFLQHTYPSQPVNREQLLAAWKAYVQSAVDTLGGVVNAWEIGNAPNSREYWGRLLFPTVSLATSTPDVPLYAQMLKIAHEVIKAADPKDVVVLGGLDMSLGLECSTDAFGFLGQLRKAGAWEDFDILGIQFFQGASQPQDSVFYGVGHDPLDGSCKPQEKASYTLTDEIRALQALAAQAGEKPVWITSIGWQQSDLQTLAARDGLDASLEESDIITRTLVPLLSMDNVQKVFWYGLFDEPSRPGYALGPFGQQTYANLATLLTGSQVLGKATEGSAAGLEEYRFQKDGKTFILVFRSPGSAGTIASVSGLQGSNALAFSADSVGLSSETSIKVSVNAQGVGAFPLAQRPVIIIASSGDPLQSLKLGIEDRVTVLSTTVRSGVSNMLGDVKSSILKSISNWLDGVKQKLFASVKGQVDKTIP